MQERKFVGGSGQISECMAKELGERVKLESPVCRIDQSGDAVVVETLDKQTYTVSAPRWNKDRCSSGGETSETNKNEPTKSVNYSIICYPGMSKYITGGRTSTFKFMFLFFFQHCSHILSVSVTSFSPERREQIQHSNSCSSARRAV